MKTKALLGAVAALLVAVAWTAPARAESARNMMLEVKFGPYRPSIDAEFTGQGPYDRIFGGGSMFMFKLEFDYEVWQRYGTIAVGGSFGYGQQSGSGLLSNGERSTDSTTFHVFPFSVDAIYRFDWLQQKYKVPLVPNFKGGFDYYIWWVTAGSGKVSQAQDPQTGNEVQGRGGVFGGHVTFGLQFLLDWLAPEMAQTFDTDIGVNNTYLFAEFTMSWVNNFKAKPALDLSSKTFFAGIAFEF